MITFTYIVMGLFALSVIGLPICLVWIEWQSDKELKKRGLIK